MTSEDMKTMQQHANEAATLMKALSHPSRLMILCLLNEGELCVGDLQKNSHLSQSSFSQQLSVLKKYQLVTTRKERQMIYYALADNKSKKVIALLHKLYCKPV